MALANLSDSPPNMFSAPGGPAAASAAVSPASIVPVVDDGLAARASSLIAALGSLVSDLDPAMRRSSMRTWPNWNVWWLQARPCWHLESLSLVTGS